MNVSSEGQGTLGDENQLKPLLTVREVAEILQVHPKTVIRLTRSEGLPCLRLRARLRFDPADVVRWVSARKEG